ncbi:MAG: hypothetical protein RSB04_11845 [Gordonibacter sp.]|uniref:hypothetical protein n=1 Tax=Gordonibacter sp. TaxID=1968902 RepID=UPI002FC9E4A5
MALNNLKAEIARSKYVTQKDIADLLKMTLSNVNKKINEFVPFTTDEIKMIRNEFFPDQSLDYLLESDGDVPTQRELLHNYAEAIGNALTKDGTEPDAEADDIVKLFHDCADVAPIGN